MTPVFIRRILSHTKYRKKTKFSVYKLKIPMLTPLCILSAVLISVYAALEYRVAPLASAIAEYNFQNLAGEYANSAISKIIVQSGVTYEQLYKIEKNSEGGVTALTANIVNMNKIKTDIMNEIQNSLLKLEDEIIKIPIGTISGLNLLTGLGPSLSMKVLSNGSCSMDFRSRFTSAGINQTKQEIYIEVISTIDIIVSGSKKKISVTNNIPIIETVIVGSVPNAYFSNNPLSQN